VLGVAAIASLILCAPVGAAKSSAARSVRVRLQPRVMEFGLARVSVSGLAADALSVRVLNANDPAGLAYRWAPYRWRRLRVVRGRWRGTLLAPPLLGVYQLQLRVPHRARLLQSPQWLLRVLPPGALRRGAFPSPKAVIRNYVSDLPGDQVLEADRAWSPPAYDHRDPRLVRLFVIAYAPRGDERRSSWLGRFIATFRDGFHGGWRLLEATVAPPD
jgi:hypothetical protein